MAAQQPAALSGIAHVAFRVADLGAAHAFYNKLGFDRVFDIQRGEQTEAFLKVNDRQFIELYTRSDPSQPIGLMHVCYETPDIEALHAEYLRRGIAITAIRKGSAGNLMMNTKDPEGQTIEFTQYLPGSRHSQERGKHLGEKRVAELMLAAVAPVRDVAAVRGFYADKLAFSGRGLAARLRLPGDSLQELELVSEARAGIRFAAADLERSARLLAGLGLAAKSSPTVLTVSDPDGVTITFSRAASR